MTYSVRPVTPKDVEGLPHWIEGYDLRPDNWSGRESHSLLLQDGDEVVGAGMLWHPQIHRSHYELEVRVDPLSDTKHVASEIVARLLENRKLDLPVMASAYIGSQQDLLLSGIGARTIQMVPPATIWIEAATEASLSDRFDALPAATVSAEKLSEAVRQMYVWTHAKWAPVDEAESLLIGDLLGIEQDVDMGASSVVVDGRGEIEALSLVWVDGTTAELIAETTTAGELAGEEKVESCVKRSLRELRMRSVEKVVFDGHVTDSHFFPVWIRLDPRGKWFRIIELTGIAQPRLASKGT